MDFNSLKTPSVILLDKQPVLTVGSQYLQTRALDRRAQQAVPERTAPEIRRHQLQVLSPVTLAALQEKNVEVARLHSAADTAPVTLAALQEKNVTVYVSVDFLARHLRESPIA